ncbi:DUF6933 domain-containing protein [Pediococcus siamensis]|uniref:DUF6933 domain-containing protein n=1 Tax=Pediococcus siamensis TaxID=381829 RepID=UPI0039A25F70
MLINSTKKALPIFNKLVKVENAETAKQFAKANPLFSWHANYFTRNRKKVLLLINDLTYAIVVLYDINAKNKMNLDKYIFEGIHEAFKICGISEDQIASYFKLAEKIQVGAGFNRQATGALTNLIMIFEDNVPLFPDELIQEALMSHMMKVPFQHKKYVFANEAVQAAFKEKLKIIQPGDSNFNANSYHFEKTWKNYHQWDKYEADQSLFDDSSKYDQFIKEVQTNNKLLLESFRKYLTESEGLSKKVVNRHVNQATIFINEFLLYHAMKTPLGFYDEVDDYLGYWFPEKVAYTIADIKSSATSIKKLLKFMVMAGEIEQSDAVEIKMLISDGVEIGSDFLQSSHDFYDGWE